MRTLVIGLVAAAALIGLAPAASAHAELLGTSPSNGEHLASSPSEIVLRFSEKVTPVRDGFSVLSGQGKKAVDAQGELVAGDSTRIRLPIPERLPDGVYSVTWRVVSADSHPVHGAFVFSVGTAQAAPLAGSGAEAGSDPVVGGVFWLFRLLGFGAVALLLGGVFFALVCWPAGQTDPRLRRIMKVSWWTATAATVGVLLLQGANSSGSSILSAVDPGQVLDTVGTNFGILVVLRLALLVLGAILLTRREIRPVVVTLVGLALVVTWSASGHAVAGDLVPFALAMDIAHLSAMSVWLGGLVVLVACVLWRGRKSPDTVALGRFSRVALIAVAVLAGTGVLMALREVGLAGLLSGSRYVTLVVFKAGALGLVLWLAAMSRTSVQRQLARPARKERTEAIVRLRRSVWSEAGIAVVVLGLTAALVATPPAELYSNQAEAAVVSGPFLSALALPGGDVQVWVSPASPGDNEIVVNVRDERGINRDVPEVSVTLTLPSGGIGPLPVPLSKTGRGQYVAARFTVPSRGTWRLSVRVRTTDLDATSVDADVPVS
ncbi:copper resistance CopC/CopD family protein [Actinocrispum wychmicini]|uniref:Copper transport protein n=1 Tax=Actinocrispum wychmicini TaxID=1213861 RepID=A0A4R2IP42_9PSEU|nr:copper resistance protein CopC [Actinocrispum wychmicini]TCO46637.1 copper transport protein [Actinocrispum wychmicini]